MAAYLPGVHRIDGGYLVRSGAVVPGLVAPHDSTLWIGAYTTVQGGIETAGSLAVGRGSVTWDQVQGGPEVVVGAGCTVAGDVSAQGRIVVQAGATVGDVHAGGDVFLLGDCKVGDVEAGGDIVIVGTPQTGALRPQGRVVTRPF